MKKEIVNFGCDENPDIHDFKKPEVGQKVTRYTCGDKNPATVIAVRKNGREVDVQRDSATDVSLEEQSICFIKSDDIIGNYIVERDEEGVIKTYTLRSNNRYVLKGESYKRNCYLLPHEYVCYDTVYGR